MVPLMVGGSIILPDQVLWTPEETLAAMRAHGANNASIPTTYMQATGGMGRHQWRGTAAAALFLRRRRIGADHIRPFDPFAAREVADQRLRPDRDHHDANGVEGASRHPGSREPMHRSAGPSDGAVSTCLIRT